MPPEPKLLRLETWGPYLVAVWDGHAEFNTYRAGAPDESSYCSRCHWRRGDYDPDDGECHSEITDMYERFVTNMVTVISLAAAAQRARDA